MDSVGERGEMLELLCKYFEEIVRIMWLDCRKVLGKCGESETGEGVEMVWRECGDSAEIVWK